MEVGISAVLIGMLIGSTLGTFAAYMGGLVDVVIMRIIDMFLAFPTLILALAIAAYLGPSERNEIIAISFFSITGYTALHAGGDAPVEVARLPCNRTGGDRCQDAAHNHPAHRSEHLRNGAHLRVLDRLGRDVVGGGPQLSRCRDQAAGSELGQHHLRRRVLPRNCESDHLGAGDLLVHLGAFVQSFGRRDPGEERVDESTLPHLHPNPEQFDQLVSALKLGVRGEVADW